MITTAGSDKGRLLKTIIFTLAIPEVASGGARLSSDPGRRNLRSRWMMGVAVVVLLLATLTLTSCFPPPSTEELVGEYLVKYPDGSEVLTLAGDGTYRQEISLTGIQTVRSEGRWSYRDGRLNLDGYIEAYDFWDQRNPDLENAPHIIANTPVTKLPFVGISFMQSESNSYEKQD
jgi:hypothetical protein